jgi:hypothetical protein
VNWVKVIILVLTGGSKVSDHMIFSIYSYYRNVKASEHNIKGLYVRIKM